MKKISFNKAIEAFGKGQEITVNPKGLSMTSAIYNVAVKFSKEMCESIGVVPNFGQLVANYERQNYPRKAEFYIASK